MKKLLVLFTVVFIGGIISAQVADDTFESGYQSGYYRVAAEYPKVTPINSQWQTLDEGNTNAPTISGESAEYKRNLKANYNKGYIQGKSDAKKAIQLRKKDASKSGSKEQ